MARQFLRAARLDGAPEIVRFSNLYDAAHAAALIEANRLRSLMQYQGADVDVPDSLLEALSAAVDEGIAEVSARLR